MLNMVAFVFHCPGELVVFSAVLEVGVLPTAMALDLPVALLSRGMAHENPLKDNVSVVMDAVAMARYSGILCLWYRFFICVQLQWLFLIFTLHRFLFRT